MVGCLLACGAFSATGDSVQLYSFGSITPPIHNIIRLLNFETGDFSQIGSGEFGSTYASDVPVITRINPYSGNYACNVSTAQTRPASMMSYVILSSIPFGHEIYFDLYFYAPPGFDTGNNWDLLWEWYPQNDVGANQHLGVGVIDGNGVTNNLYFHFYGIQFDWGVPGADPRYDNVMIYSGVGLPTGRYVHFRILYNSDDVNGEVQVKMDNTIILDWQGKTTFNNTPAMQWAFGTYCGSRSDPHWFEYDDVTIQGW